MNINSDSFDCGYEEWENEEIKVLELTRDEVLYIDDSITMMIERDVRSDPFTTVMPISANAGLPSAVDLLDKVGMAVLQATEEDYNRETLLPLQVTLTELYMLREIAKSSIKLNGKFIGLSLKRKIYKVLYEKEYKIDLTFKRLLSDVNLEGEPSALEWSGESG